MNDNEWISVDERLPGYHTESIFRDRHNNQYKLKLSDFGCFDHLTHWRPIPEKRPDFSKLNRDDIIILEFDDEKTACKFSYYNMSSNILSASEGIDYFLSKIKKITRINLEEQTFEEI